MSALSLTGIDKVFGSNRVLSGVSLDIQSGEFFSLLGPSGCGKSTLLRIISGLESANSGSVTIGGKAVDHIPPQGRGIGMVFQQYALWPHMTIAQNVRFGLESRPISNKERDSKMISALERVQMLPFKDRFPHQISGGQQQRVALARALAMEPTIILLDEPLSNLDARLRAEIRQELADLHSKLGATMIYVTHDQEDALSLSSRIAIMNMGQIEQVGSPLEIYTSPNSPFCARFIGDANLLPCRVTEVITAGMARATLCPPLDLSCQTRVPETGISTDTSGYLCIRPNAIKIIQEGMSDSTRENTLRARVIRSTYKGSTYDLELIIGKDIKLKALCSVEDYSPYSTEDSEVLISWENVQCVFVAGTLSERSD
jgi:ABC-type Fe3+/spermidine/putrescine transport system ATPase subunit